MSGGASAASSYWSFLVATGSWFAAWGMQGVLFAWLVVSELGEPVERLGVAQFALVLPSLFLLLLGGALADRREKRSLLAVGHVAAGGVVGGLTLVVASGWLSFPLVVAYALLMGSLSAFVLPTRDALLSAVAGPDLLRAIVGATLAQFLSQFAGAMLAGAAGRVGLAAMLAVQATLVVMGLWAVRGLPRVAPLRTPARLDAAEVLRGLREVWASESMRPVMLLGISIGLFFIGPYFVVLPELVRSHYAGEIDELGRLQAMFPLGTILGSLVLLTRGAPRAKGAAIVIAQGVAALSLLVLGIGPPFRVAMGAVVVWGLCGAVVLNSGRTIFQEAAAQEHLARVLSVYSLAFMGAGALGSPFAGFLAGQIGPLRACTACAAGMLLSVLAVSAGTRVLRVR